MQIMPNVIIVIAINIALISQNLVNKTLKIEIYHTFTF